MSDNLKSMKVELGDILIEENCDTCEFNAGTVCMGYGTRLDNGMDTYGMPMEEAEKMFSNGCGDYGISLEAYVEQEKLNVW